MVSIFIILILVYWSLYKIIKEFKWLRFYRGDFLTKNPAFAQHMFTGFIELIDWNDFIWVEHYDWLIFDHLRKFRAYINRHVFLYDLGLRGRGIIMKIIYLVIYIPFWILDKLVNLFFGSQQVGPWLYLNEYTDALSSNGQQLFYHEYNVFNMGSFWRSALLETVPANDDGDYDYQFMFNRGHLSCNKYFGNIHSYHLTEHLYYNGRVAARSYSRRRARSLVNISSYGILEVLSVRALRTRQVVITRRVHAINNRLRNPNRFIIQDLFFESQNFKHSGLFEFVWAIYPSTIIFTILVPSLYLLYSLDDELDPDLTVKVIGHQWYWSYEFDNWIEVSRDVYDFVSYKYNSNIMSIDDLELGTKRLLEVDKRLVLPINFNIRFVITSSDVLHSWAVPSLGIKSDAVPGRLNQFLAYITYPGVYYGQCSESCGAAHGFMPIVVQGVSYQAFVTWLKESNFC